MPEERDLVAGVIQLGNVLMRRLAPVLEKAKITPQQWAVLSVLGESEGPLSLAGLARKLLVSKQNMTGMVARLEQLGLTERNDDPNDLRSWRVGLTRRGRSLVEKFMPAYEEWRAQLGRGMSDRDMAALTRTVDRLIGELEQG
jgi:MarR family 2-MHQ and catechol resistance regulon transcriptional repressor